MYTEYSALRRNNSKGKKSKFSYIIVLSVVIILLGGCGKTAENSEALNAEHVQTTDIIQEVTKAATPTDVPATITESADASDSPLASKIKAFQTSITDIFSQYNESDYLESDYSDMKLLYQDAFDSLAAIKEESEGQPIVSGFIEAIIAYDSKTVTALERAEEIIETAFSSYDSSLYTAGSYLTLENLYKGALDALSAAGESEYDSITQTCIDNMDQVKVSSIEKTITIEQFETRKQEIISALSGKSMTEESITAMLLLFNIDSLQDDTYLNYYEPDTTYNDYCVGIEALRIRYRTVMRQTKPENAAYLFDLAQFIFNENDLAAVKNMDSILMECTNGYRETITANIKDFMAYYTGGESSFPVAVDTLSDGGNLALNSIGYPFANSFMGGYDLITEEESMEFYSYVEPYLYENNFLKARYEEITAE